jgi:hypothetical protein
VVPRQGERPGEISSGHGGTPHGGRPHLCQDPVQPLERPVEVELDPARGGGHRLASVLGAPALDKAQPKEERKVNLVWQRTSNAFPPGHLIVHILVSWYTASNPWLTDWDRRAANSYKNAMKYVEKGEGASRSHLIVEDF